MGKGGVETKTDDLETNKKEKIRELLERSVVDLIDKDTLVNALQSKRQLRVKFGIDPTDPKLHLGHAVGLLKLKQFQELNQRVILLVGDFTGRIGDPTGRMAIRKPLSEEQIISNIETFKEQAGKILSFDSQTNPVELRYNSEWLAFWDARDFFFLAKKITANQILSRKTFAERMEHGKDISIPEFIYPVLQGYDSYALEAGVELGGTEQIFNLMMGRRIQRLLGQKPQVVMTLELLPGIDGNKMSKSAENTINFTDSPEVMRKKLASLSDKLIMKYFTLVTRVSISELDMIQKFIDKGNVGEAKEKLIEEIISLFHPNAK